LDRLGMDGLVERDHEEVVDGRLRRYYALTGTGREVLTAEVERMAALAARGRGRLAPLRTLPGSA
jgi:DNA-binding PadR family transcriptional regulator